MNDLMDVVAVVYAIVAVLFIWALLSNGGGNKPNKRLRL